MSLEATTVMKAKTLGRHIRESFKSMRRNGWMTFASISAVTVTLFLVGVFTIIMMNLNVLATNIENNVEIKATVDQLADEEVVKQLQTEIEQIDGVLSVTHSTKDEELERLIAAFGDEFKLHKMNNPLGDAFYIKAKTATETPKIAEELSAMDQLAGVEYGKGKVEKLFKVVNLSRNIGIVLIIGLVFTAMFLISNTIKLTINARGTEIEIMKLVGATNGFVRIPFVLEGIWLGIFGSILPIAVLSLAYTNLYAWAEPQLQKEMLQLLNSTPFLFQLSGILLLIGVFIGIWGSFMSVRKFLKV